MLDCTSFSGGGTGRDFVAAFILAKWHIGKEQYSNIVVQDVYCVYLDRRPYCQAALRAVRLLQDPAAQKINEEDIK